MKVGEGGGERTELVTRRKKRHGIGGRKIHKSVNGGKGYILGYSGG